MVTKNLSDFVKMQKPIYRTMRDKENRGYHNAWLNEHSKAIVSHAGKNVVFEGNPKIVMRDGHSIFGEEIIFQLIVSNIKEEYKQGTNHDTIEIYLPKAKGLKFLKDAIAFFETKNKAKFVQSFKITKKGAIVLSLPVGETFFPLDEEEKTIFLEEGLIEELV